jgi:TPR repeat protein
MYNLGWCYSNGRNVAVDKEEAAKWFRKAADLGDKEAMYNLGVCYLTGEGVPEDKTETVKWYRKAAALGNPMAARNLGNCYINAFGVERDFDEAVKWFRVAAEQDLPEAFYSLGICYMHGQGVEVDKTLAVEYFRKAADGGYYLAQQVLEKCEEDGVEEDADEMERSQLSVAFKDGLQLAEQGQKEAQYRTANHYVEGLGVEQDIYEAIKWYRKAAEQGHAKAQHELAMCYYEGDGVDKNMREAIKWCRKAAEQGYARSQFSLGAAYANGEGVDKDEVEAAKWLHKSAEQGHPFAQYELAKFYLDGVGVEKNFDKAIDYLQKAAEQGLEDAQKALVHINAKIMEDRLPRLREAAEQGDADAQFDLFCCYWNGIGVEQDRNEADEWLQKAIDQGHEEAKQTRMKINVEILKYAAEQGDADAQFRLALCYDRGVGVEQDTEESIKWSRKAAEHGDERAQYYLGAAHFKGDGVIKDQREAVRWWQEAAKQGNAKAQSNLGGCYLAGNGVEVDATEAVNWWQKAADQGNATAQYDLGMCYFRGTGIAKDEQEAVKWLQKSAGQEYDRAKRALGYIKETGKTKEKADGSLATFTVPYGAVENVIFSPDDQFILAGRSTGEINLWKIGQGKKRSKDCFDRSASPEQHWRTVNGLWFSKDGKSFFTGGDDGKVYKWNATSSELLQCYVCADLLWDANPGHGIHTIAMSANEKWLAASGYLPSVEEDIGFVVWNLKTATMCGFETFIDSKRGGACYATSVAFSPDHQSLLVTGGHEVHLYELGNDGEIGELTRIDFGFEGWSYCGTFSPSGRWIMATSDDKTVKVWDTVSNTMYRTFEHPDCVRQAVFSPDERLVLSGCTDGIARLWNLETGEEICCFEGHTDQIEYGVAFSTKGDLVATGSYDGTVKLWKVPQH